ncbi:flavin reductase family protein [Planococcus sp. ISL-109]|uniref:flavin reductase family protein n=1 Tax=Planococcus sp. ISL-109 TaxID=2819166 RepID=UPI001BE73CDE|nr:flavin reductase family protein [Planococcus sp. ISL-109]MBT2581547.1 flavin reductase family protein [Planococcus sp. ISL-109]
MIIDPKDQTSKENYKLLIGSVLPRPIAWVSSVSKTGELNLAPFSFFTVASRNPPMLIFSIGEGVEARAGTVKDTLANIRERGEFVVNIVSGPLANEMARTGEHVAPDVDEFAYVGLTPIPSQAISVPRVEESPVSMECVLEQVIPLGDDHLVIGKVLRFHIQDELYDKGRIDTKKLAPIGRLAGNYSPVESMFSLPNDHLEEYLRPPVDKDRE